MSGWSDFFVASAGAAGALVGLAFVAISINLAQVIELPGVAGRAAETIILLAATLAASLVALIPHLRSEETGAALAAISSLTWLILMLIQLNSVLTKTYYRVHHAIIRFTLLQLALLPGLWGALSLYGWASGSFGFFAVSMILSMLVAMTNAWILLIEIIR